MSQQTDRLIALDYFRGLTVAGMVLVNNPGDPDQVYPQLTHVDWNGLTVADIIAPWFLWVIGVTTALSLSRRESMYGTGAAYWHVIQRAIALYFLGVVLTLLPEVLAGDHTSIFAGVRLMGILQRIAICYAIASLLFLLTGSRVRIVVAVFILIGYCVTLIWLPGPAGGAGPFDPTQNRAFILDRQLIGNLGETGSHSLLTIPAVTATILLGTLCGELATKSAPMRRRLSWIVAGGAGLCVAAIILSHWIPINRRLWTPSFVALACGVAMVFFAVISWGAAGALKTRGEWLIAYGANPIFLFTLSELGRILAGAKGITDTTGTWQSYWMIGYDNLRSAMDPKLASAAFALIYTILIGLVAVWMYRKRWIVKI